MIKQYKKELIVSTLLALLPIAAGLLLWNRLPGQLATHWGMSGADRWSGKAAAVFLRPLLLLAAHYPIIWCCFSFSATQRTGIRAKKWWGCCSG